MITQLLHIQDTLKQLHSRSAHEDESRNDENSRTSGCCMYNVPCKRLKGWVVV